MFFTESHGMDNRDGEGLFYEPAKIGSRLYKGGLHSLDYSPLASARLYGIFWILRKINGAASFTDYIQRAGSFYIFIRIFFLQE